MLDFIPLVVSDSIANSLGVGGQGTVVLNGVGSGTDQKNTALQHLGSLSGTFRIRMLNDAATDGTNAYTITRSGTQPQIHAWTTATSERMRLTAAGRLLIGTTTEGTNTVDIAGNLRTTTGANFATSSGGVLISSSSFVDANDKLQMENTVDGPFGIRLINQSTNSAATSRIVFGTQGGNYTIEGLRNGNELRFVRGTTESMRITSGGELLINTTSDAGDYKLQVAGNVLANFIYTRNNTDGLIFGTNSAVNPYIQGGSNNHLYFGTSNTPRLQITTDGELLVNTSTDAGDYRLQVNGNANFRDDVLIDTNLRVNRHIALDQTLSAWSLGNAVQGPQGATLFLAGGGVQSLANIYYDGAYKYTTSNPGAAMFLLQSGITFATYGSGTANGSLTGANEMVYAGGELRVGLADQGTYKLQVADKSYFGDEMQIASTTDLGNYKLQVTGEAIITAGIRTDAPSGGTAATWKLGTVATVSPTSPNRTIEVEIGGTTYYIHAKTTNN
jgi:hypothetical protein